jgi:hypothetical protein
MGISGPGRDIGRDVDPLENTGSSRHPIWTIPWHTLPVAIARRIDAGDGSTIAMNRT